VHAGIFKKRKAIPQSGDKKDAILKESDIDLTICPSFIGIWATVILHYGRVATSQSIDTQQESQEIGCARHGGTHSSIRHSWGLGFVRSRSFPHLLTATFVDSKVPRLPQLRRLSFHYSGSNQGVFSQGTGILTVLHHAGTVHDPNLIVRTLHDPIGDAELVR